MKQWFEICTAKLRESGTGVQAVIPAYKKLKKPFLNRLVPIAFRENRYWGSYGIRYYYGLKRLDWVYKTNENFADYDMPVVADCIYHTIYADDERILIALK